MGRVFTTWSSNVPQLTLTVDPQSGGASGCAGIAYFQQSANCLRRRARRDFSLNNRVYHVVMQNEMQWRERAEQISELFVRKQPRRIGAVEQPGQHHANRWCAVYVQQYNQFPSVSVSGSAAERGEQPHGDGGDGNAADEHLPQGYDYAWSGLSWQEQQTGNQAIWIVLAAVAMAWLFLVAQYESWTLPASVMLSVLFAIGGALLWLWIAGLRQRCVRADRAGAIDSPGGKKRDS